MKPARRIRSSPRTDDRREGMTRYVLSPTIEDDIKRLAEAETRSISNMVSILITEAVLARRHRDGKS